MKTLFGFACAAMLLIVGCASSTTSSSTTSGPACTGAGEGSACVHASDCKPAACKCTDGSGSDVADMQVCLNLVCSAKSACTDTCASHGGVAKFAVCS